MIETRDGGFVVVGARKPEYLIDPNNTESCFRQVPSITHMVKFTFQGNWSWSRDLPDPNAQSATSWAGDIGYDVVEVDGNAANLVVVGGINAAGGPVSPMPFMW